MILITGYLGFIGNKLHSKLPKAIGLDVREGKNILTCELPKDIDTIYHLAAQSDVVASWQDPLHDLDNIRITARLVHEYPKTKIIYANSAAAISPIKSPYGFSKWASGEYIKTFHTNYALCRFPNVFGPGSRSVVDKFKGKSKADIYGDGLQTRDYVHVDDIVSGLILAKDWEVGEYDMGSGQSYSVLDLAGDRKIEFMPKKAESRHISMKNTTPNWKPIINVMDYLK